MAKRIRAYKRSARKQQVIKQLRVWRENEYAFQATSYRLAKALDLTPSPHFRDILNEMVMEGDLVVKWQGQAGRWDTAFYLLAEKHIITEKYSRRHISVKSRGRAVGQLELFS